MKVIINLVLLALAVTSCGRDNDSSEIIEKTSYNFVYTNSYKVNDIVLYKGPLGDKENPKRRIYQKYMELTYSTPEYSQIDVDTKK